MMRQEIKKEHAVLPVACHVFFLKDDKIFLMKRANTGFNDGKWSVPAGRLDQGESLRQAAIREAKEEVGAVIKESDLDKFLMMSHKDSRGERLYSFFTCSRWENKLENLEPESCSEVRWFSMDEMPVEIIEHVKFALDRILSGECYAEFGYEAQE